MKLSKINIYPLISLLVTIISIFVTVSFNWGFVLLIVLVIFLVTWIFFLLKKNDKLKKNNVNYEKLLNDEMPLNELLTYLAKNKNNKHINKCRINRITLYVKIVGDMDVGKRNDVKFSWALSGLNSHDQQLDRIWFRFSGNNFISFNELQFSYYDCTNNATDCFLHDTSILDCIKETECKDHCANFEHIKKEGTYNLIELLFIKPKQYFDTFKIKCHYTWPQCYNPICDYLILDPSNFSDDVAEFTIKGMIDGTIITKDTRVQMFSLNKFNYERMSEGKFNKDKKEEYFYLDIKPDNQKIYYAKILNIINN